VGGVPGQGVGMRELKEANKSPSHPNRQKKRCINRWFPRHIHIKIAENAFLYIKSLNYIYLSAVL
jgi:hypothetical protein